MTLPQPLQAIWDDTGYRAAIIAAVLIFLLETIADTVSLPLNASVGWYAVILALIVIARVLTGRPLRGDLSLIENRSLLLGILLVSLGELFVDWTTLNQTFLAEPTFWPYWLLFGGLLLAARVIASRLDDPLDRWLLLFGFLVLWMNAAMWAGNVIPPSFTLTWTVMLIGAAVIVRGVIGSGKIGPLFSAPNLAVALFVLLLPWLEYGAQISGAGWDWSAQELYWPWILWTIGLAALARVIAPALAVRLTSV